MSNQTPHTPQTPIVQKIKPPVITPEMQRLVEQNRELIKTALPAMEENERRKRELEKLNQQETINLWYTQDDKHLVKYWQNKYPDWYRENWKSLIFWENFIWIKWIHWEYIKFEREDFSVPTPEKKKEWFFKKIYNFITLDNPFRKIYWIWKESWFTYFTFDSAQEETEKLWKRVPDYQAWQQIISFMPWNSQEEKRINLVKLLKLDYAGYYASGRGEFIRGGWLGCYWTNTLNNINDNFAFSLRFDSEDISSCYGVSCENGLLVRCLED